MQYLRLSHPKSSPRQESKSFGTAIFRRFSRRLSLSSGRFRSETELEFDRCVSKGHIEPQCRCLPRRAILVTNKTPPRSDEHSVQTPSSIHMIDILRQKGDQAWSSLRCHADLCGAGVRRICKPSATSPTLRQGCHSSSAEVT